MIYISGGRLPGCDRVYPGTADRTPPLDDRPFTIAHELYFAQTSPTWNGGGVAFVSQEPDPGVSTYARLYRISAAQFLGVFQEENGSTDLQELDWDAILNNRATTLLPTRWYGAILNLGTYDGDPVLTFTWNSNGASIPHNVPVAPYLQCVASGLAECHGLTRGAIVDYVAVCPGIRGALTRTQVARLLSE